MQRPAGASAVVASCGRTARLRSPHHGSPRCATSSRTSCGCPGSSTGPRTGTWAARELATSRTVDQVIGAFFLVRRPLFDRLGGFDERYFLYYEEVDFARRALAAGWSSFHAHEVCVEHVENVSAKASGGRALSCSLRSRTLYARRHWPLWQARLLVAFTLLVELPLRLARTALGTSGERREVRRAAADYWRFVREGRER